MKKLIILIIIINIPVFANWQGDGTEEKPYEIWNKADLEALADSVANWDYWGLEEGWSRRKYFKIMNNINEPVTKKIGRGGKGLSFQGHIDGQNYKINLNLNYDEGGVGLFGIVTDGATIKNIVVSGSVSIEEGNLFVGGIVGVAINTTISNCVNLARVKGGFQTVGGIVGEGSNNIIISNCINVGTIIIGGNQCIGGIVGCSDEKNINISNCINAGYIKGTNKNTGGIVGHKSEEITIINCVNIGVIEGKKETTGGIQGKE